MEVSMRDILIRGLIIGLIVQIFLSVMRKSQRTQMHIDQRGNKIVQYSSTFKVFSVLITVGGAVLVIILFITSGFPVEFVDWLAYLVIFILMAGLSSVLMLEVLFSQVCISEMGIRKKSIWTKDFSIQWKDIQMVSHSRFLDMWTIKSKKGNKIKVSCMMDGVHALVAELKSRCPEVFS